MSINLSRLQLHSEGLVGFLTESRRKLCDRAVAGLPGSDRIASIERNASFRIVLDELRRR